MQIRPVRAAVFRAGVRIDMTKQIFRFRNIAKSTKKPADSGGVYCVASANVLRSSKKSFVHFVHLLILHISGHNAKRKDRGKGASRPVPVAAPLACFLGLSVRILPGASMTCECCVPGRGLCVGLITRPEEFYRARARARVCVCVCVCVI